MDGIQCIHISDYNRSAGKGHMYTVSRAPYSVVLAMEAAI